MVFVPVIGFVVDRFRRKPFLVVALLISALGLSPLLLIDGREDLWILYLRLVAHPPEQAYMLPPKDGPGRRRRGRLFACPHNHFLFAGTGGEAPTVRAAVCCSPTLRITETLTCGRKAV